MLADAPLFTWVFKYKNNIHNYLLAIHLNLLHGEIKHIFASDCNNMTINCNNEDLSATFIFRSGCFFTEHNV